MVFVLFSACKQEVKTNLQLCNPLPVSLGDPYILKCTDGNYYMYGTSENLNGFKAYSSKDLHKWEERGVVLAGDENNSWGKDCFWAPEVYERDGRFYLWYSANWKYNPKDEKENFRIGVAVADSPIGPFKDLHDKPIFDPGYPIIDANLYFDDQNHRVYLYYSRCCYKHPVESEISELAKANGWFDEIEESWIYGVEIEPDFSATIGEPQMMLRPPLSINDSQSEWESRSVKNKEINRRWTEGSFLFKESGIYYMVYSANYFGGEDYAVGYATAKNPLGPFEKAGNNPVLQKNTVGGGIVTGTGHNMVLTLPNKQKLCVYHARTDSSGNKRIVFMDKLTIEKDGNLTVEGPTVGSVPL